ncbi:extensin-like [Sciurus carolinensis]|uniref:extensin-like n=1 Tax=Sciurus carolinensis TaxID=30640 RepID=UPI001FB5050A|nr:extensin-like [Sciurus carolinensis]
MSGTVLATCQSRSKRRSGTPPTLSAPSAPPTPPVPPSPLCRTKASPRSWNPLATASLPTSCRPVPLPYLKEATEQCKPHPQTHTHREELSVSGGLPPLPLLRLTEGLASPRYQSCSKHGRRCRADPQKEWDRHPRTPYPTHGNTWVTRDLRPTQLVTGMGAPVLHLYPPLPARPEPLVPTHTPFPCTLWQGAAGTADSTAHSPAHVVMHPRTPPTLSAPSAPPTPPVPPSPLCRTKASPRSWNPLATASLPTSCRPVPLPYLKEATEQCKPHPQTHTHREELSVSGGLPPLPLLRLTEGLASPRYQSCSKHGRRCRADPQKEWDRHPRTPYPTHGNT